MKNLILSILVFIVMALFNFASAAEFVDIDAHSSRYMKMDLNITRIAVGSAEVAKVVQVPDSLNEFLIVAQKAGTTNIFVWTTDNVRHEFIINVATDEDRTARLIEEAINLPNVHVKMVEKRVLLTGTVENQFERNHAIQVARLYAESGSKSSLNFGSTINPQLSTQSATEDDSSTILTNTDKVQDSGNVIDLLQMLHPTQIRLEAQVLSINSSDAKDLGILYGNSSPSGSPGVFSVGESLTRGNADTPFRNNPLRWLSERHADINMQISALITNNKAKILSRPSVMTLSGEQATIQIGGEIPYTYYDSNDKVYIKFRDYGIILQFKPIVDSQNNIVSTIYTEVSNISGEYIGDNPIISTRRADSVVSLKSGTTMVIGGLMDSSERKIVNKIPLLGDIPIIGEFFKYSSTTKDKQELIILVTPYIVGENETSRARMSEQMENHYREGRDEKNSMNDVDVSNDYVD